MEKARALLEVTEEQSQKLSRLRFRPHRVNVGSSFYEDFALRGIRVDRVEPGLVVCFLKVPPRLADENGHLSSGAIANIVDELGASVIHNDGQPMDVSVDMSISYVSRAKLDLKEEAITSASGPTNEDELEISATLLGQRGRYYGTSVLLKNKNTGEIVAEGRHSLFSRLAGKL